MEELTKEDIQKNRVNTIPQYYILKYLKKNLNTDEFNIYLVDRNNIKVVDKTNDSLYFNCEDDSKNVTYSEELKIKEIEITI